MHKRILAYRKRLERIEELLDETLQHSNAGAIIIVEGKRDVIALKKLGFRGDIETASHQPLLNFSERIANTGKEVIILTDWDRRGSLLASKIAKYMRNIGTEPNLTIRGHLKSLVKKEIKDVESLYTYVMKLRKITGYTDNSHLNDLCDM